MVPPRVYKSKGPCWKRFGKFYIDVSLDLILKQAKFNIVSCMLCCVRNIFMYKAEIGAGTFPGKVYIFCKYSLKISSKVICLTLLTRAKPKEKMEFPA